MVQYCAPKLSQTPNPLKHLHDLHDLSFAMAYIAQ